MHIKCSDDSFTSGWPVFYHYHQTVRSQSRSLDSLKTIEIAKNQQFQGFP